jgi:hypothetical protein
MPICLAMSVAPIPSWYSARIFPESIVHLRPNFTPLALASMRPSLVRSRSRWRSAWATADRMGDDHFAHRAFGADAIIQKADGNADLVKFFDQGDHVRRIPPQPIQLFYQDHITFFDLDPQRMQTVPVDVAAGNLISKNTAGLDPRFLKGLDLPIKGLLAGGYTGITKESHRLKLSPKSINGRCVY